MAAARGVSIFTVDGSLLHINPFMAKRTQPFEILGANLAERSKINKQIVGGATCMENDRLANLVDCLCILNWIESVEPIQMKA